LATIEFSRQLWPRVLGQRALKATREVSLSNARHLAWVAPHRLRGCTYRAAFVEKQQHANSTPNAGGHHFPTSLAAAKVYTVSLGELEPCKALRMNHPKL
jgi:hypothetical protein